jgi:hypothetical protein
MRMPLSTVSVALATLLVLTSGAIGAEEQPSADPAASTTELVGPISWKRNKTAKGFGGDAHVSDILQHAGANTFLCGLIADQQGLPKAALWSSTNATKWKPVKWPAPDGSSCSGLVSWSGGLMAVGRDGSGRIWTSETGKTWAGSTIGGSTSLNDVAVTSDGLAIVGDVGSPPDSSPRLWLSADGVTWDEHPIAAAGSAQHVVVAPDGTFVVAGKLPGEPPDGTDLPTVWTSGDGVTWEEAAPAGLTGDTWFIPALRLTPVGYVLALSTYTEDFSVEASAWTSQDGSGWEEALAVEGDSISAVGTVGPEALLVGPGGTWRSADGVDWTMTKERAFARYDVLGGIIRLADGRWLAAGDTFDQPEPGIATWIGTEDR